jgi:tRNA pseudouridine38-40 synthase
VGRHDFTCFRAVDQGRAEDSPIVVVERAEIDSDEELILFRIEASHFLWRMVRRVVGLLVRIGTGQAPLESLPRLLAGKCDPALDIAGWTAPSSGLFIEQVSYRNPSPGHRAKRRDRRTVG